MGFSFFKHSKDTDEELLISIGNGNNSAFNELYFRYKDRLLYYFYRMLFQDKELAEDFLQDIFIKIINKTHLFDPKMKFSTWIFSIANNMCKNEYRRQNIRKKMINHENPDFLDDEQELNTNHEPVVQLIFNQLQHFDDTHRSAFLLKYKEGFSVVEISKALELPIGTVKSRLFYTRKRIQENLKKQHPELIEQYNLY